MGSWADLEGLKAAGRLAAEILQRIREAALAGVATRRLDGFTVLRDLCRHGLGRALRQEPLDIFGCYVPEDRRLLREGQVLAIEPFVSNGARDTRVGYDGWSLKTRDGSLAVQYEHTGVVTREGALVLTAPEPFLVASPSGAA